MAITEITRRAIIDELKISNLYWWGDFAEPDFLDRIYPLSEIVFHFKLCGNRGGFVKPCKPKQIRPLRVGLFGTGLDFNRTQFKGLKWYFDDYARFVRDQFGRAGAEVVNCAQKFGVATAFRSTMPHDFKSTGF